METEDYKSIEELEFDLLEEVKIEQELYDCKGRLNYIINHLILKVIKVTDDYLIVNNNNHTHYKFHLIKGKYDFKEGDFCSWNNKIIKKINVEVLDETFIDKILDLKNKHNLKYHDKFEIGEVTDFEITQEMIIDKFKEIIDEKNKKIEERERLKVIEDETKNDRDKRKREQYEKESIFKNKNFEVDKKTIMVGIHNHIIRKYILKKNVSKVLEYWEVDRTYYSDDTDLGMIENKFIETKESYEKHEENDNKTYDLKYKVDFKVGRIKVNGVKVLKNKLNFVLNRIKDDTTDKEIKQLNKMSGMNVDFLNLKEINFDDLEIDIKIGFDDDLFEVEFIGKKKKFDWEDIKEIFFYGGKRRSVRNWFNKDRMLSFCERMNISKQELFKHLKKLKLVNSL